MSRGLAILSEMPVIVTLLDLGTGTAAFQNSRSRAYWGELRTSEAPPTEAAPGGRTPAGTIFQQLMSDNEGSLDELLESISAGASWKKVG